MPALILIPWHIGDRRDLTLNAVRQIRRLTFFAAEDPESAEMEFERALGADGRGKTFIALPEKDDPVLLERILGVLESEDVGLVASGGAPCFVDPGAWLVRALRRREIPVTALAGASCLPVIFSLSGLEWTGRPHLAGIFFFAPRHSHRQTTFAEAFARQDPAVAAVVLLRAADFSACVSALLASAADRRVSVFFDLTKDPQRFPYAGRVRVLPCSEWLKESGQIDWRRVSDVALLVHPAEETA